MTPRHILLPAAQIASAVVVLSAVAAVSIGLGQPILVPSLAACVFLQLLLPDTPAAKPWAVIVGQSVGLAGGMAAVSVFGAATLPTFAASHPPDPHRAAAAVLAAAITLGGQRALGAGNAAGAALAVTVALGDSNAGLAGAARGMAGILIVAALGEIARRLALRLR